ncbi:MAG: sigma-70 family RNA polymerase sigma factor [Clostridia bacterium]|nr:sigma-70 family RNA polymerase sigma factor [Clostridia bacterium]
MSRKIVVCGVDTSSLPKLTAKESRELLQKIKQGDKDARNYFIHCNMRLVLSVVQRYIHRVGNPDDLFQIGCVGLIKSVDNFNVDLNVRFSTYAVPMIVGEIRRFLRESNSLRVSRGIRDVAYQALQAREKLESETSAEVSMEQIAEELHLPIFKVMYCLDAISDTVSLSDAVYSNEEDSVSIADSLADDKISEVSWVDNISLFDALEHLDGKERSIILKRYFQGKTQTEISQEIGLNQAQISRLEKNAISQLRADMS